MKISPYFAVVALGGALMASGCGHNTDNINNSEVARLEGAVREAFARKNPELLLNQYYWEGPADRNKEGTSGTVSNFVMEGSLVRANFAKNGSGSGPFVVNASGTEINTGGAIWRPNLRVVGAVEAVIALDQAKVQNSFFVGETNGRLWFIGGGSHLPSLGQVYRAAFAGDFDKVKSLIENDPALVNEREEKAGNTGLHGAIIGGHNEIAEYLIAHKADLNAGTKYGITSLHSAVARKNLVAMELLLRNGANPNSKADGQITPLYYAVLNYGEGSDAIIALLLEYKADPALKEGRGDTPLNLARAKNLDSAVKILEAGGRR